MTTQLQYGMGGERSYSLYYQHSGKTPIISILLAGLAGVAAGIVLAFVYAYVDAWCPYAKGRALAALGFGLGVGGATAAIAKGGKVRSLAVVLALVGAATLVAYYFSWIFWIEAVLQRFAEGKSARLPTYAQLIFSPPALFRLIKLFNANGYWSMSSTGNDAPTGIGLTVLWIAEAACIFGTAFTVAYATARSAMFCEACNRWCNKMVTLRSIPAGDAAQTRAALEAHDFSSLEPGGAGINPARFWSLDYEHCHFCNKLHALTIRDHKLTIDKKKRIKGQKVKTLIDRLLVDPDEIKAIRYPAPVAAAVPVPVAAPVTVAAAPVPLAAPAPPRSPLTPD
jgi:hypothetical protein